MLQSNIVISNGNSKAKHIVDYCYPTNINNWIEDINNKFKAKGSNRRIYLDDNK